MVKLIVGVITLFCFGLQSIAAADENNTTAEKYCSELTPTEIARFESTNQSRIKLLSDIKIASIESVYRHVLENKQMIRCLRDKPLNDNEAKFCTELKANTIAVHTEVRNQLRKLALLASRKSRSSPIELNSIVGSKLSANEIVDLKLSFAKSNSLQFENVSETAADLQETIEIYKKISIFVLSNTPEKKICEMTSPGSLDKKIRKDVKSAFLSLLHKYPVLRRLGKSEINREILTAEDLANGFEKQINGYNELINIINEMNTDFESASWFSTAENTASKLNWTTNDFTMALLEYKESLNFLINKKINADENSAKQLCADLKILSDIKNYRETGSIVGGAMVGFTCLSSMAIPMIWANPYSFAIVAASCSASIAEGINGLNTGLGDSARAKLDAEAKLKSEEEAKSAIWDGKVSAWTNGTGIVLTIVGAGPLLAVAKGNIAIVAATKSSLAGTVGKKITDPATSLVEYGGRGLVSNEHRELNGLYSDQNLNRRIKKQLELCSIRRKYR